MDQTFGERLLQVSKTIDILDEHTFKDILKLIEEYTKKTLNIKYVSIMTMPPNNLNSEITILNKFTLGDTDRTTMAIKKPNGEYCGQTAYSFDKEKPLWVLSDIEDRTLKGSKSYIDQWSQDENVPEFISIDIHSIIKTSIIIPISRQNNIQNIYGVVNFETEEYIEITEQAKSELINLSKTISHLVQAYDVRNAQHKNTTAVIERMERDIHKNFIPKLTKPKLFLASAGKSENDVIGIIKKVINENYSNKIDCIYWKDITTLGNINNQTIKNIISSRYGICYFSELSENNEKYRYIDNPNVLFEAGMMHAKIRNSTKTTSNWIPIREISSPKEPFDFSSERILYIERDSNNKMNIDDFIYSLKLAIDSMLSEC